MKKQKIKEKELKQQRLSEKQTTEKFLQQLKEGNLKQIKGILKHTKTLASTLRHNAEKQRNSASTTQKQQQTICETNFVKETPQTNFNQTTDTMKILTHFMLKILLH